MFDDLIVVEQVVELLELGLEAEVELGDQRVTTSLALMRTGSQTVNPFGSGSGDGEYAIAIRETSLPYLSDDERRLVHVGMSYMHRARDDDSTSPGDRPLVRGGAGRQIPNVLQTGRFFSPNGTHYINPEVAMILG